MRCSWYRSGGCKCGEQSRKQLAPSPMCVPSRATTMKKTPVRVLFCWLKSVQEKRSQRTKQFRSAYLTTKRSESPQGSKQHEPKNFLCLQHRPTLLSCRTLKVFRDYPKNNLATDGHVTLKSGFGIKKAAIKKTAALRVNSVGNEKRSRLKPFLLHAVVNNTFRRKRFRTMPSVSEEKTAGQLVHLASQMQKDIPVSNF